MRYLHNVLKVQSFIGMGFEIPDERIEYKEDLFLFIFRHDVLWGKVLRCGDWALECGGSAGPGAWFPKIELASGALEDANWIIDIGVGTISFKLLGKLVGNLAAKGGNGFRTLP